MTVPLFGTQDPRRPVAAIPARAAQEPMPEWLVRRLTDQGHIDAETGATRRARMTFCPTCRRPVMLGVDSEVGGMPRRLDPTPLDVIGELELLLAGAATWELRRVASAYQIDGPRDRWQIRARPAGADGLTADVLAEHQCETRHPDRRSAIPEPAAVNQFDEPPF